jgi:LPS export ABC transporter protein LptC
MIIEKNARMFLLTFILILLVSGLLFFLFNRPEESSKEPILLKTSEADVVIERFHLSQSEKDRVKWELRAESAEIYRSEKKAVLKNIELTFRKKEGDLAGDTIILKGEEGILNTETRDVLIKGKTRDIEVTTAKGYIFTVASLRWDEATRRIISDDDVTLIGPNIKVNGKGISINVDLQQIEVLSNVRTVLQRKEG